MADYRRVHIPGARWFFTVNLAEHKGNRRLVDHIDALRQAFIRNRHQHTFKIEAIVVLPDHLHCIWALPPGDDGFSVRWGLIKSCFSQSIERARGYPQAASNEGSAGFGKGGLGIILSATMRIITPILIISK